MEKLSRWPTEGLQLVVVRADILQTATARIGAQWDRQNVRETIDHIRTRSLRYRHKTPPPAWHQWHRLSEYR